MFLGILFAFIYDIKEDSIWLVPMFCTIAIIKFFLIILTAKKENLIRIFAVVFCIFPSFISFALLQTVRIENLNHFGFYLLNTRTQGEMAKFISTLYQIDSKAQTTDVWAPADTIEKVFKVSPTLKKSKKLHRLIRHYGFASPSMEENPVEGDLIIWHFIDCINQTIGMQNQAKVQKYFAQVNNELNDAFKAGTLKKTQKIKLVSSLVPRTKKEIKELIHPSVHQWANSALLTSDYQYSHDQNRPNIADLKNLGINPSNPNPQIISWFSKKTALKIAHFDVRFYRLTNIILLLLCLSSVFVAVVESLKKKKWATPHWGYLLLAIALGIYSFCYSFLVNWFAEYVHSTYIVFFYTSSCIAALMNIGLLLGAASLLTSLNKKNSFKHQREPRTIRSTSSQHLSLSR